MSKVYTVKNNNLLYLENSVDENVSNDEVRRLSELVNRVKSDKDEEDRYMTVGDRIDSMIKAATAEINAELIKKDAELARLDEEHARRDAELARKDAEIARLKAELLSLNQQNEKVNN